MSIEGIRKGYLFHKKWFVKGEGLDLGAEYPPGKNLRSRLTALALIWFLWDVKEPTPLFEKSKGCRPRWCGQPSHIIHILGWVGKSKFINGLIPAASGAFVC